MLHSSPDNTFWDLLTFARSGSNTETQNDTMNVFAQMDMMGSVLELHRCYQVSIKWTSPSPAISSSQFFGSKTIQSGFYEL